MELSQALALVNAATLERVGRQLSEVEVSLLTGAWEDETYEAIADRSGYSLNYLQRDIGPKFWKLLSDTFNRKLNKTNLRGILTQIQQQSPTPAPQAEATISLAAVNTSIVEPTNSHHTVQIDWGEMPDVSVFYGRTAELETLTQWILGDRCRVVALLGMGGIGKSSLAAKATQELMPQFEAVIWRSLRNAPPLDTLLTELVLFLSDQQDAKATPDRLLHWLRTRRCLVILDNLETILQPGDRVGFYQPGYENYGDLLRLLGETNHQSCVVLTSREKPGEISTFETADGTVRSLSLAGSQEASLTLIAAKRLIGTDSEKHRLCEFYNCSPLALKIVAASIHSLFAGEIANFLAEETMVFNGLRRLLDQQFERLSPLEQTIMYWLAVNREWTTIAELMEDIVPTVARASVLEALESLTWRSLVEMRSGQYTQQPVVMEYVTDRLIQQITAELLSLDLCLISRHALLKTTVLHYIRESQHRVILQPLAAQLTASFRNPEALHQHFQAVLQTIRNNAAPFFAYGVGNVIKLCLQLQLDLTRFDFSHFKIRQVNFQGNLFPRLQLAHTELKDCRFTQTFGGILAIAFSPDNRILALGDSNGTIRLWELIASPSGGLVLGQPLLTLMGHTSWILSLAWHPDGQRLVSSSDDRTLKLWDAQTGDCLQTLQGHTKSVWWAAWSPDGSQLASAGGDRTIKLWNVTTGDCLQTLHGHESLVYCVAWHPQGTMLASGGEDHTVRLWDVPQSKCLKTMTISGTWVRRVAWSPDGTMLASASADLRLWDGQTGELLRIMDRHITWVDSLAWSPDGSTLASGGSDRTIKLRDPLTGDCLHTLQGHHDLIWGLSWSMDSKTLASGSYDQSIRLWNAELGQCQYVLQGYTNTIRSITWSPASNILASSSTDKSIRIWDVGTGQCLKTLTGHEAWIFSVAWSPRSSLLPSWGDRGDILASSSADGSVRLWDVKTGQCLRVIYGHTSWVWSVDWHPDGTRLASGSSLNDLTARIWDAQTGDCLQVLSGHQSWINWVAWSPDGAVLATVADDQQAKIWDGLTGDCLLTLQDDRLLGLTLAWSPDGQWLATSSTDHALRLWDVTTGICERELTGHNATVWAIAWSPDGKTLASSSDDGTIKLWDLKTGTCRHTAVGHQSRIFSVVWSPDGSMVASSSLDATIRLWDGITGDCLRVLSSDRPYEGMNIIGIKGITEAQKTTLKLLGAIEQN